MNSSGILCKRMDDEGYYGDKQLRITGNIMALTDDGWKTVKMAVGESIFYNPFTQKYELKYGIQASVIVGELMCSENMFIGNKDGSVRITGDGITISNGVIKSSDYEKYGENHKNASIIDLKDGSFSFAGGGLSYKEGNLVLKDGVIRSVDYEENENGDAISGSMIDLTNGNFSFAGRGLIYDGNNELTVNGHIEATSIYANEAYELWYNGDIRPVLMSTRETSPGLTGIWGLRLKLNDDTYVDLRERTSMDFESVINVHAHNIHLEGNTYSQTGQIIASDRNVKDNIKPLTDKHMKFFSLLQPVSFTFIDGESGRTHIGFISQDVEDAMSKAGLTDLDFAGFCRTVKTKEIIDVDGNKRHEAETDENGEPVYVYALRYEEFIALNTFMIQNMNKEVENLRKENQDIKERLLRLEEKINK